MSTISGEWEYLEHLKELERLMDLHPVPGTEDANKLDHLVCIIEDYEKEHFHFEKPSLEEVEKWVKEEKNE